MKCSACGYQYEKLTLGYKKLDIVKSGKNKGSVRGTVDDIVTVSIGNEPFIEILVDGYKAGHSCERSMLSFYECPVCGTLRRDNWSTQGDRLNSDSESMSVAREY